MPRVGNEEVPCPNEKLDGDIGSFLTWLGKGRKVVPVRHITRSRLYRSEVRHYPLLFTLATRASCAFVRS